MKDQQEIPFVTRELLLFYRKWIFLLEFPFVALILFTASNPLYTFYAWIGSFFLGTGVALVMIKANRKPGMYIAVIRSVFMFFMVWFGGKDCIVWMFYFLPIISTALTLPDIKERMRIQIPVAVIVLLLYLLLGDSVVGVLTKALVYSALIVLNAKVSSVFNFQNKILEVKNKEITDSIHYAQRIQRTLLASEPLLTKNLNEYFVFFKPKDIVSGDFYWATEKDTRFYLAVCDSTGHGVPGAFMSLLNISFLNEAITEKNILKPDKILNHVRQRLIENISQDGAQDGMDAVLICFDRESNLITYAAANNRSVIVKGSSAESLVVDKMPVGKGEKTDSFTLRTIEAQKGDTLYLYTDGYADQFGGPKGKKFKYKQLEGQLLAGTGNPMEEQKILLGKTLEQWKGNLEQVDDILVVGIRI